MSKPVISVENISKSYQLGVIGSGTFRGDVQRAIAKWRGLPDPLLKIGQNDHAQPGQTIWALEGISFQVEQGEALGIIGRNGAGKSTLLKILSRVTAPTTGEIKAKGRIASLLEVGTGFHPELTGRENVYLNGAILGMRRKEVSSKFDEIVDFSGVEKYIDTPVKRYSSGMYVRLAFAVAAHLEPDILIVDEVLAVGDAEFQKKCLGKMDDVAHQQGRTILFVSHNMIAMQALCENVFWLDSGRKKLAGPVNEIVELYLNSGIADKNMRERVWVNKNDAPGNETVLLRRISILPENGKPKDTITMEKPIRIELEYWNLLPNRHLHPTLHIHNDQGIVAFTSSQETMDPVLNDQPPVGLYKCVCHISGNLLNSGYYRINILFVRTNKSESCHLKDVIAFEVTESRDRQYGWYGKEPGVVHPIFPWSIEILDRD